MANSNAVVSSSFWRGCRGTVDLVTGWTSTLQRPCCQFSNVRQSLSKTTSLKFRILPRCGPSESRRRNVASTKSETWRDRHVSLSGASLPRRLGESAQQRRKSNLLINAAYISPPGAPTDSVYYPLSDSSEHFELEKEAPKRENLINAGLIVRLVLEEKRSLAIVFLSLIFGTTCTLSMPIFSGRFFETLIGVRKQPMYNLLLKLFVVYLMEPVFTVIFVTNMIQIWEKVMKELRFQVFQRVLIQKVEFFDEHKVGELTSLLSTDLNAIKDIVNENVARDRGFRSLSEVFGTVVILFVLSPELAPVMSVLMISIAGIVAIYKRTTMPVFKAHGLSMARISDLAGETFSAIRTVRSFGGERRQTSMFQSQVLAYQESGNKLGWLKAANESWTRVVVYVALMALYILGGAKVNAGELPVGRMVSFIGYTFTLTFAMQGLVNTLADLRGAFAAVDRINTIIGTGKVDESLALGLELDISEDHAKTVEKSSNEFLSSGSGTTSTDEDKLGPRTTVCDLAWSGDVALEDVHFAYPSRPDAAVLRGVNIILKSGTVTALVGTSGSGKSTIVQLLARFYEPTKGRITLGGEDVRKFDKTDWARAVSIVNQEPVLFAMSIGENIAYGAPFRQVSKDEIVKAAEAANAHDFIQSLPEGYNTMVGERGSLLSGGQRQRVAIARALLKDAPILILDEATSSLDSVSERLVQDALDILMKGRTTLVIAHRLSTVQAAHQIVVCGEGRVLETGTHLDLLSKKGTYANLVQTQRVSFE
ncbi:hypothetical protein Mapa_017597 [Marchantia paleacea]|nr:hypothetical protein Mapa_017597 [Marchantia paleacea]